MLILNILAATSLLILFVCLMLSILGHEYLTKGAKDIIENTVKVSTCTSALLLLILYLATSNC